jgi:hypothetical protein
VANTDTSNGPGEHWIAIYWPIEGEPLYFDSYGLIPQHKEFTRYLGKNYYYNGIQLQSPFSATCGQYAIFFTAMACRGCTMKQIQDTFDRRNLLENDNVVTQFINRNYNMNTPMFDVDFITEQICNAMNKNLY